MLPDMVQTTGYDWNPPDSGAYSLQVPEEQRMRETFARIGMKALDGELTQEDFEMVLDDDNCEEQPREPVFAPQQEGQHKRPREEISTEGTTEYWRPWADCITCTLDILVHLPRSAFSEKQLDLFVWLLTVNNVDGVPTVRRMKESNKPLQRLCGIETLEYISALSSTYSVNSLSQLLSQELSNPLVREHLWFYPEDIRKRLEEARQGTRWLHEAPHKYMTPIVRVGAQDFYTFKPAILDQNTFCIPFRWFIWDNGCMGTAGG
ncbi:hypothetical protein BKA70DRAFT_539698 [Coprinopsis sp. MPI-PUGE-AT-0042]|nr:hypothetical protein BKA70DRAFT_539698 [Coprinopsis sp. MPI-PUGE-AT-0042]